MNKNENSIRLRIAKILKQYREKAGLTIREVAALVDKSNQTISAWENGRGQPDADMFIKLCDVYGVESVAVFFGQDPAQPQVVNQHEEKLLDLFRALNEEGKERLLAYAEDLDLSGRYKKPDFSGMVEDDA